VVDPLRDAVQGGLLKPWPVARSYRCDIDGGVVACSNLQRALIRDCRDVAEAPGIEGSVSTMNVACSSRPLASRLLATRAGQGACDSEVIGDLSPVTMNFCAANSHSSRDACTAVIR